MKSRRYLTRLEKILEILNYGYSQQAMMTKLDDIVGHMKKVVLLHKAKQN